MKILVEISGGADSMAAALKAKELFKNSEIDGLRLYVSGNNLFTWTNYSGFDPEVSSRNPLIRGFERFSYPRATTVFMGLNLKF